MEYSEYDSIEQELCNRTSFEAIKYVLDGIELHDIQCIDIMKLLYEKRAMVLYDTGLGKTLLVSAMIKLLCNEDPSRRFIMFVKKDQLIQTPKKMMSYMNKTILTSSAEAQSLTEVFSAGLDSANVLMLTHTCLQNSAFMSELFKYKDNFCGIIIDEAHELNNFNKAESSGLLSTMCHAFEYCIALTATPITTNAAQCAKLAHIVDEQRYPNFAKLKRDLLNGYFDIARDPIFFISREGRDFGAVRNYRGKIVFVNPQREQMEQCGGNKLMLLCKGPGAENQANKLVEVLQGYHGKRGLVYINQHAVRDWVLPFLDAAGIKYDCINGHTKQLDREHIMSKFNEEKSLDVVITSVTTAIDLDCDYVIFYEFTPHIKQMIGRAHRGLSDKDLDVLFMLTKDTCELDYFAENVLDKSFLARDILHKNYSEMEDVAETLTAYEESLNRKV